MRNALVALYRRQPERRLSLEEAAEALGGECGDAVVLQRCARVCLCLCRTAADTALCVGVSVASVGTILYPYSAEATPFSKPPVFASPPPSSLPRSIHRFLEGWGIINWLTLRTPPTPCAAALPAGTRLLSPPDGGEAAAAPALPEGFKPPAAGGRGSAARGGGGAGAGAGLLQLRLPTVAEGVAAATVGGTLHVRESRAAAAAGAQRAAESATSLAAGARRFFCAAMPWVDCTPLRYRGVRGTAAGVDLCPQAFAEGRLPAGASAADFVRLEGGADPPAALVAAAAAAPAGAAAGGGGGTEGGAAAAAGAGGGAAGRWTPQETLLLLEGLDLYGDNWPKVAEHVGTHSMLEAIAHFLQLPIEDDFLDELERRAARAPGRAMADGDGDDSGEDGGGEAGGGAQTAEEERLIGRVPLAGTAQKPGNPVMSLTMLLSVVLAPRIGAEAAQAALAALASDDPVALAAAIQARRRGEDGDGGGGSGSGNGGGGGAAGMDVDGDGADEEAAGDDDGGDPLQALLAGFGGAAGGDAPDPERPITARQTRAAAAVALAAAAERAKLMADEQAAEMERLTRRVLRVQAKRVRVKTRHLRRAGEVLAAEADALAQALDAAPTAAV